MSCNITNELLNPILQMKEKEKSQSPKGLRVLAIDDNVVCLKILGSILQKCGYTVTTTRNGNVALEMLRNNKERFDVVIVDVVRDDIDGFKLLQAIVGLEMDIPVIMTTSNDETRTIVEGIKNGASDYLVKPIKMDHVNNIFQHISNKKTIEEHDHSTTPKSSCNDIDTNELGFHEEYSNSSSILLPLKRKSQQQDDNEDEEETTNTDQSIGVEESCPPRKKNRISWSKELHKKFLDAYHQLEADNLEKIAPKRILEIMNEPGISRQNVASHLQKYRNSLRKHNPGLNHSTISTSCISQGQFVPMPRNQHEQVLFQHSQDNVSPIVTYPGIDDIVYHPVLAANEIPQPDMNRLQYDHVPRHSGFLSYQNPVSGVDHSVYNCPYSSGGPVSMNYVGAPYHHQFLGDVSASHQMTPISTFDPIHDLVVSSTHHGQLQGVDFALSNETWVQDAINGCPINFSGAQMDGQSGYNIHENNPSSLGDDYLSTMVQEVLTSAVVTPNSSKKVAIVRPLK